MNYDISNAIVQARETLPEDSKLIGLDHAVYRLLHSSEGWSLDDIARLTFRGVRYISSDTPRPAHDGSAFGDNLTHWDRAFASSERWRQRIRETIERVSRESCDG